MDEFTASSGRTYKLWRVYDELMASDLENGEVYICEHVLQYKYGPVQDISECMAYYESHRFKL